MARKSTRAAATTRTRKTGGRAPGARKKAPARSTPARGSGKQADAGDAFITLLQSPLVADLLAVAATAALAALAEHGLSSRGDSSGGKRAGKAVKEAGKAAAAAIGRRLSTELDEIKKASKAAKGGARP